MSWTRLLFLLSPVGILTGCSMSVPQDVNHRTERDIEVGALDEDARVEDEIKVKNQDTPPITVNTTTEEGSSLLDSIKLRLGFLLADERAVAIEALSRGYADHFNVSALWQPPRACNSLSTEYSKCTNPAEREYCEKSLGLLDSLYCKLGGESREMSSYVNARFTTGDLVVIFDFAVNQCFISSQAQPNSSMTATRLGVGLNMQKATVAKSLVTKFLGYREGDFRFATEVGFINSTIFLNPAGTESFSEAAEIKEQVGAACVYLVLHKQQVIY